MLRKHFASKRGGHLSWGQSESSSHVKPIVKKYENKIDIN